jgi:hypothetical protein
MRFIVMHKVDANMESGGPPSQEIIANMGKLVQGSIKAGTFENGAGLHRSARRVRLEFRGGKARVTHGPYAGKNELVSAFFMIRVAGLEQAIEQAERLAALLGDVEIEIGPVVEPWDLGLVAKPAKIDSERFLLLLKADPKSERSERDASTLAALAQLRKKMGDEGVLLAADTLAPSARASRLPPTGKGKRTWVDGPFAESKELIAGFSILNVPTKQDALAWADQYAAILTVNEIDVRELVDAG